ncbi:MAG: type II toxin-antitoxin system Phd/YefM family antitoxin, partial [Pseudolabrys sp.]
MPAWSYNRVALVGQHLFQLGDVKSHPSELVSRVHDYHERVIVTVHGRPSAGLIAPEDLERLEETLEIMRVGGHRKSRDQQAEKRSGRLG